MKQFDSRFKCSYDQILDIYAFFYVFVDKMSFLDILPNSNLLHTFELSFFGPLVPRIYDRH